MSQLKPTPSNKYEADDLTMVIMDEIRITLTKYGRHFQNWNNDDLQYNLDDKIYAEIYKEIISEMYHRLEEDDVSNI